MMAWLISAAAACGLTPLARRIALRRGVVDAPDARKHQREPVPLFGGAAVLVGGGAGLIVSEGTVSLPPIAALLAFTAAVATGLADDLNKNRFPTPLKFALLAICALLAAWSLHSVGGTVGSLLLAWLWCFAVVNALNLSDNANGLSAGLAAIPYLAIVLAGRPSAMSAERVRLLACVAGAAIGFLPFNFPRARIFLGDLGAYGLGAVLAVTLDPFTLGPLAFGLLAVPLVDLVWVGVRRLMLGIPPWRADRRHLSHRLMALGLKPPLAVAVLWGVGLAVATLAVLTVR